MLPFLLITTREDDDVAQQEYATYCRLTGLRAGDLHWQRADQRPLASVRPAEYSGIILAGSPFTVSDPVETKSATELRVERELASLLDEVVVGDLPFLGVCYGVGTIGTHQGARVDRSYGEPSRGTTIALTDAGRTDPLFGALPEVFEAFVGHKEAISSVPQHFSVLARSQACPVQAFRVGANVYATQFHPELDTETFASRVRAYATHGYFDPSELEQIIASAAAADVRAAHTMLARFVDLYARPSRPREFAAW